MPSITLEITRAVVVRSCSGPDRVFLTTTLPGGIYPFSQPAVVEIAVAADLGVKYLTEHFPQLENIEVI